MPNNDKLAVQRGDYGRNTLETVLFVIGRLASGPTQYMVITAHPLSIIGIPNPPSGGIISAFGHDLELYPVIISLLTMTLACKHSYWQLFLCRERMTMSFVLAALLMDFGYETVNSIVFGLAAINPFWSKITLYIGSAILIVSVAIELLAELQRDAFKSKPRNKGKLYTSGLWRITRHINYTANVGYGFGFGLATGGPLYTIPTAGMYFCNFTFNAVPGIEAYCAEKYGNAWELYKKDVPWSLIPGVN